jgi:tetratricopeptide (TPR) repeat protein
MLQESNVIPHALRARTSRCLLAVLSIVLLALLEVSEARPVNPLIASVKEKFDAGKYEEVTSLLQAALAQEPQDSSLAFWLMRSYFELGMFDQAISYADRAVKSEPSNSEYHLWLGRAYGRKAEKTRSFRFARKTREGFETAVNLNPANLSARRDLMEFYLDAPWILGGGKEKGWRQAAAIAEIDPVEGCLARGFYWQTLGKTDSAEAEYAKVLELRPGRIEPYFELADFYQTRQEASRLEAAVEAAAHLNPGDCRLAYYRGVACILARKHLEAAEPHLKTYLAAAPRRHDFPSHASAHVWLGRLYEELGKLRLAAEQYKAALELAPGRKDAVEGLRRTGKTP